MGHTSTRLFAPITTHKGGDIDYVLGISSGVLAAQVQHANNNKYSLFKPMAGDGANIGYVTVAERKVNFQSLIPQDLASLRSTATFVTVPTPVAWGYKSRAGFGKRPADYLKIVSNLSEVTEYGYDGSAEAPMQMATDVTCVISTSPTGGDLLCPTFKYNEQSANAYGSANIQIFLRDLVFRYYGEREDIAAWKLPSSYDDIFNADGALTTGVWRFAIALALKTSASGPYRWLIVSSVLPLEVPFVDSNFATTSYNKMINLSANQTVANIIKYAVRNYGQTVIPCIPFLACNLNYTSQQGWYFGGGTYDRAITFPNADTFNLTPSGFATTLDVRFVGFRVAYTNSNDPAQNVSGLTWYTGQAVQSSVFISLPRPTGFSYCIMEVTFNMRTHFGITSNMVAGMLVNSSGSAGQLFDNGGQAINNISGEWIDTDHTYKVRCMGSSLHSVMANTPANLFPLVDTDGFDMYFDNNGLASRQHKLEAGTGIALQS